MAITGRLLADFNSFYAAVEKADVQLKGLDSGASRVSSSLNRAADSFSGRKIVQDANIAAEAVERIGGATKLTESEQRRLNSTLTEAIAKYNALGEQAPKQMTDLAAATAQVEKNTDKLKPAADSAGVSFKSLFGAFSLGSIAANVVGSLATEVTELVSKGNRLPAIEQSFERLSTSIGEDSSQMLSSLQAATRGMVSEFDLMQSSNKALLLGLPVTAQSMGDMAAAATALGKAMGMDATKSLDDLITALGRSSPMILDNLGLSVKLGDANQAMADKLGKSVESLSDAEKKQAFYEAAMEAARKKTKELGEQTETLGDIAVSVWANIADAVTKGVAKVNTEGAKMLRTPNSGPSGGDSLLVDDAAVNRFKVLSDEMDKLGRSGGKVAEAWGRVSAPLQVATMSAAELKEIEDKLTESAKKSTAEMVKSAEQLSRAQDKAAAEGVKGFKSYRDMLENVNISMGTLVNKRLEELGDRGQRILRLTTDEAVRFGVAMSGNLPVVDGIGKGLAILGEKSETGIKPAVELTKRLTSGLGDISIAMSHIGQVAGGTFGAVARGLSDLTGAAKAVSDGLKAIKSSAMSFGEGDTMSGFAEMSQGVNDFISLVVLATQGLKSLFSAFDRNKGRDVVKDFAESFGGFDQLHAKLLELEDSGEALWVKLTQGVGRNNPEQAARVIAEIEAALARQAEATEAVTDVTEDQAQATIETASQAAKALDELGPRLKDNEDLWMHWGDVATNQIKAVAATLRELTLPSLSGGLPTLTAAGYGAMTGGSSSGGGDTTIMLDGQVLYTSMTRRQSDDLRARIKTSAV